MSDKLECVLVHGLCLPVLVASSPHAENEPCSLINGRLESAASETRSSDFSVRNENTDSMV